MANQFGIEMGRVIDARRAAESDRMREEEFQMKKDKVKMGKDNLESQNKLNLEMKRLRNKFSLSDDEKLKSESINSMNSINPKATAIFLDNVSKMDKRQLKKEKENAEKLGSVLAFVLQSDDPEKSYNEAITPFFDRAPKKYDPMWVKSTVASVLGAENIIKNAMKTKNVGNKSITMNAFGQKTGEYEKNDGKSESLKPAEENLIYKSIARQYGATLDENGNIVGLTNDNARKVASISEDATKIYKDSKGRVTMTEASNMAIKNYNKINEEKLNLDAKNNSNDFVEGRGAFSFYKPKG